MKLRRKIMSDSVSIGRQRFNSLLQWGLMIALGVGGITAYKAKQSNPSASPVEASKQSIPQETIVPLPSPSGIATPIPVPTPNSSGVATPIPVPSPSGVTTPNLPSFTISTCNGISSDANLRSAPTIQPWAVVGVVTAGQQVLLTGRTVQADGETWHEVIAPTPVSISGTPIQPNQPGWIAGCFVR
jgi:hypothetical protein